MPERAHHYVPQTYLRGFFDPDELTRGRGVLWKYVPGRKPMLKGTKRIAQGTNFYDLPDVAPEENDVETLLAEIENNVAAHLSALRQGHLPDDAAKLSLSLYIALQWTRTPLFREVANSAAIGLKRAELRQDMKTDGALAKLIEELRKDLGGAPSIESIQDLVTRIEDGDFTLIQANRAWNAKIMLEFATRLGTEFVGMRWKLLEGERGNLFISSNNPMYIVDPAVAKVGPGGFTFSMDTEFYLPVSPRFTLIGDKATGPDARETITAASVRNFNVGQMQRAEELYASFRSNELRSEFDQIVKNRPPLYRELPKEYLDARLEEARRSATARPISRSQQHHRKT